MKKHFVFLLFYLLAQFFFQVPCAYAQAIALTESKVAWRSWNLTNKRGANFLVKVSGNTLEATDNTINDGSTFVMDAGPDDANWTTPDSRWFFIRSLSTGLYITVAESGDLPRSVFLSAYDENSHAQQFRLVDGGVPNYKLRSRLSTSGPDLVLETDDDGHLRAAAPISAPRQNFTFSLAMPSGSGRRYTLVNSVKARYISDNGIKSEGTHAVQNKDADESAIWHLDHVEGDWYRIRNNLTQQFLTAPEGADPFTYVDMTAGTYGDRSQWKLERNNATFLVSNREFPNLFLSINVQSPGEPLLLMGADDLDRRLWVISLMPEEVEVQTGDYDRIETGVLSNDCFFGYGPNFKKGLCERVGLNPEHSELYFEFIRDAIAAKMGANRVDEILQKFALGNAGHRVDLVIMVRQYLTEELTTLPYAQWSPAAQSVVTELQNKVQALRLDYASRLMAAWTAYVAEHGSNIGFADLYFFWIDGDGFVWPAYYNANETQALLIRDYASGAATFGERNVAIVGNTALGAAVGISMVYSVTSLTPSVAFISGQIFSAGIGQAAFPFGAIAATSALPITVAVVAATSLAFQVMEVIEFQDFQNDLQYELIWAQQGINIPAILISNSLLDRVRLLADLDYLLGAPVSGSFQYNANDNAYLPPFTLNCQPTLTVDLDANGTATLTPDQLTGGITQAICGGEIGLNLSESQFDCGDLGNHTVTLTAQNTKKTEQCNVLVTVRDATAPSIVCPENQTRNTDLNQCSAVVNYVVTGSDNCTYTLAQTDGFASGLAFPTGTNVVNWKVTDVVGSTAICSFKITVTDNAAPSVVCKPYTANLNSAGTASIVTGDVFQSGADNCGTVNQQSVAPNAFTCNNLGANTVTLTVNDGHGNTNTCNTTVTVEDNVKPTVVCKNATVYLDAAGTTSVTTAHVFQSGTDNCGTVNQQAVSPNMFDCNDLGANTVALTVNDGHGNTQICNATVTVVDDIPPVIVCPSPIARNTDSNQCSAVVNYIVTGSDNCTYTLAQTNGFASGQAFPTGTNVVNWKVTDVVGSTAICSFTITVTDNQTTSITCPSNISKTTDPNQCSAVVMYANPSFSDNCTGAYLTRTSGLASGTQFPTGMTNVAWKATDLAGNSSVCNFVVSVTDGQAPAITCPTNIVKSTDAGQCSAVVTYANPTYSDNCTGAGIDYISGGLSGSIFPQGTTSVIWQATDAVNLTKRCTFTVTVNDAQVPTIACPANQTKVADSGLCTAIVNYATPTFTDNCAGSSVAIHSGMASGSAFPKGQTTVQWKATDAAGLTKTCIFRVTVNDTQVPVFTLCPASQSVSTDAGQCTAAVTYATPTASDNCTPPPTVVKQSGLVSGSNFPKGTSTVVWRATDGAGLTKTCSFTVTVTDAQLPTITCPSNMAVTGSGASCNATVAYASPTATDNCGIANNHLLSGLPSGAQFSQGVTTNIWKATDNSGLTQTCAFTVTVGCGATSEQLAVRSEELAMPTTDNRQMLAMNLAPNPATTEVWVWIENLGDRGGELTMYDAQGRMVWQQTHVQEPASSMDVSSLPSGLYQVRLRTERGVVTKSLVVNRL